MDLNLKNKTVIVTGAASNIGRGIALAFSAEGAKVAIADLNVDGAQKVAEECRKAGAPNAIAIRIGQRVHLAGPHRADEQRAARAQRQRPRVRHRAAVERDAETGRQVKPVQRHGGGQRRGQQQQQEGSHEAHGHDSTAGRPSIGAAAGKIIRAPRCR